MDWTRIRSTVIIMNITINRLRLQLDWSSSDRVQWRTGKNRKFPHKLNQILSGIKALKLLLELERIIIFVLRPLRSEFGTNMATEGLTTSPRSRRWYNISQQISGRDHAQTNEGEDDSDARTTPKPSATGPVFPPYLHALSNGWWRTTSVHTSIVKLEA
jgi:hypothetical protein